MLEIEKKQVGSITVVTLKGSFDEQVDLEALIGRPGPEVHLQCHQIQRVNSVGIRHWSLFFHELRNSGVVLKFLDVPPALVDVSKIFPGFLHRKEVESLGLPFLCLGCEHGDTQVYLTADLEKLDLAALTIPCPKCGGQMKFDDIPEEFLLFLSS